MSAAELILGWILMIAVPSGGGFDELVFRRAYATEKLCRDEAAELLAAPRYQGAIVIAGCVPALINFVEENGA